MLYNRLSIIQSDKFDTSPVVNVKVCECLQPAFYGFGQQKFGTVQDFKRYFDSWIDERHLKKFQSVEINAYLMFNKFQKSAL